MSTPKTMLVTSALTLVTGKLNADTMRAETVEHPPGSPVRLPAPEAEALIARGVAQAWRRPGAAAPAAGGDGAGESDEDTPA